MTTTPIFLEDNSRKNLLQELESIYGIPPEIFNDYEFVVQGRMQKIWVVKSAVKRFSLFNLKPVYYGMYFAKKDKTGLRLTMNGAQVFGKAATKNIVDVSKQQYLGYLAGENITDIKLEGLEGYVLLQHNNQIFGCGKVFGDGILNFVAKTKRLHREEGESIL